MKKTTRLANWNSPLEVEAVPTSTTERKAMSSMKVTFRANLNDNGFNKDGTVTLEFERVQELELDLQPRMLRPDGTHRPLNQAETDDLDACLVEWEKKQLVRTLSEFIVHKEQS